MASTEATDQAENNAKAAVTATPKRQNAPLSEIHLGNMLALSRMGVRMVPPMPAFYNHPRSVDDIVDHVVARVLYQLELPAPAAKRWAGIGPGRVSRHANPADGVLTG
ncbi:flavoprotein [Nonomuraea turcica]|uniref:flavoprotein n=1 Tax=Nonomuraea sp. G32 TaxID=3067274 RepID=UPI00273A9FF0|nr:flavoprotein [Nonomuraea sp. G32]MDP4510014.1 hypothetical protein [Nonomuraea sp. G32]